MNIENNIQTASPVQSKVNTALLNDGLQGLAAFRRRAMKIAKSLEAVVKYGDRAAAKQAKKLQRSLMRVEPSVTMIGQVKAGKTSLVNSLIGWPDLLPADVNPWTSVVTAIHLSPRAGIEGDRSAFRFFDSEEWDRLLDRGGRIGELAGRAGAEDELKKVARQLERMREKSKRRLGDKFEMLMGQEHRCRRIGGELIERYVCLGDDFESDTETSQSQGRFADITKSADLYMQREEYPVDFCIRDTPGVNDTFMMREQITIRAIRESRMCVVVLSAHQALSTVDMALIRLISNLPSREVMIFVNRIDELADPVAQVPEIEKSIRKTLKDHQGPDGAHIVFGSAYWANHALKGQVAEMSAESRAALAKWQAAMKDDDKADLSGDAAVWRASGVPQILGHITDSVAAGMGAEALDRAAKSALNLMSGVTVSDNVINMRPREERGDPIDLADLPAAFARVSKAASDALEEELEKVANTFNTRLERSHKSFLDRATATLISNLERNGDSDVWQYDATGLRVLLRTAFQVFSRGATSACNRVYGTAASDVRDLYLRAFGVPEASIQIEPPAAPHMPAPVLLGQTIALDLSAGWWSKWWRRRKGYQSFATDFAAIIQAETDPIVDGLRFDHVGQVKDEARAALNEFLAAQKEMLETLAAQPQPDADAVGKMVSSEDARTRTAEIEAAQNYLSSLVKSDKAEAIA